MELRNISNIKVQFAELIYSDPSLLQSHDLAKQSLILYETFLECLTNLTTLKISNCYPDLSLLNSDQIIKFDFTLNESSKKIIVKILYLKDEQQFSFNCLKKFDKEELYSFKIEEQKINEKLDDFIQRAGKAISEEFINKLGYEYRKQGFGDSQRTQGMDDVNLRPRNIGDDMFRRPYQTGQRDLYPGLRPNIRYDPTLPPNIGGGDLGPVIHPMFPEFQNPGTQMGPQHPYFRGPGNDRGMGGGSGPNLW